MLLFVCTCVSVVCAYSVCFRNMNSGWLQYLIIGLNAFYISSVSAVFGIYLISGTVSFIILYIFLLSSTFRIIFFYFKYYLKFLFAIIWSPSSVLLFVYLVFILCISSPVDIITLLVFTYICSLLTQINSLFRILQFYWKFLCKPAITAVSYAKISPIFMFFPSSSIIILVCLRLHFSLVVFLCLILLPQQYLPQQPYPLTYTSVVNSIDSSFFILTKFLLFFVHCSYKLKYFIIHSPSA